ncbi:MAG: DUF3857 domain-containing protein [Kiritimatiellaeota bacterium]|nr:DUF3857 domain-containing protein [Kiritimatiellota bacterium]
MNTNTRWIALGWVALVSTLAGAELPVGFLLPQDQVAAAAGEVTAERFADADRVLVDDCVWERYEKDGTSVTWDDEYVKILTEKGRREGAQFTMQFSAHYGTALVYRAEIIKPDGRVVAVDVEAYSKVATESGQMSSNIYDPQNKILSVSLPGLEVGDVCHVVSCRRTVKARVPDTWSDRALFEYDLPIVKLDYNVSAPPGLPIIRRQLRMPVGDSVAYSEAAQPDGRTLHSWRVRDVPQIFPEPNMPPMATQVQRMIVSTIGDWRDVSRWYWNLCQPALGKTVPEMQETVNALVAGAETREEKIARVFKFVSQEIRYMGITTEDTAPGYEPHEVGVTFKNRYGVCRDKAALLAVMLTMAGVQGYPVLIHAGAKMDPDVPVPFFNHAITAVDKPGGGYILMDPTDEHTRDLLPSYLGNRSYLVARPEGETLLVSPVAPAGDNMLFIVTNGSLGENGTLLLDTRITFNGINDNAYRGHFLRQKADQRRKFFEGLFKARLPGAEVLGCEITPNDLQDTESPLEVSLVTRVPDFPVRGEGLDTLSLPWLGVSLGYVNFILGETGLDQRRYTLETGLACGVREQIQIGIGKGMSEPHVIPEPVSVKRTGLDFELAQSLENETLIGTLNYQLTQPEFSPEEYLGLKQAQKEIEAAWRRRPLFTAKDTHAPDHETLFTTTDITLHTPSSWTTTTSWSKRILTYAGKKNNAEIKLPFNPVWQELELISATVSNLNGDAFSVTPQEVNVMDAPWAGAVPRYPAGKILIANLPGVETGSVITVTTRLTQTQAPFFSTARQFGGTEPVRAETLRLTFPRGMTPATETYHGDGIDFTAATNAATVTWQWAMARPPLIHAEELLPPWHLHQPTVLISCGTWRDFSRTLDRALTKAAAASRDAARRRAKQLVKGIRDPYAKMRAIRDDVLTAIRPAGPSFLDFPLTLLTPPDQTLADQYGHAADRALLMSEMLNAAGLDAHIVFASTDRTGYPAYSQPQRDTPQRGYFSQPLVRVRINGTDYYLNEGDQYDQPGATALHRAPLLTRNGKIDTVTAPEEMQDRSDNHTTIDLDERGTATITIINRFHGTAAGRIRKQYQEMLPEDRRRHHLELISRISKSAVPASDLITDTDSYPVTRTYVVTAPDYAVIEGDTLTLLIPDISSPIFPLRGDTRKNPLFLPANDDTTQTCLIHLPPGYTRLPLLPESKQWELPNGLGTLNIEFSAADIGSHRRVTIAREQHLTAGAAPAQLYPALLEYNRLITHPSTRTLVAERDPHEGNNHE